MSRYRRLKIEGGAFFYTLALADRGSDLLGRVLINSAHVRFAPKATDLLHCREVTLWTISRQSAAQQKSSGFGLEAHVPSRNRTAEPSPMRSA
jgi:hypothetical protein